MKSVISPFPRLPPVHVPSKRQKEHRASIIRKSFRVDRVPIQTGSLTGVTRGNGDLKSVLSLFPRLPPVQVPSKNQNEFVHRLFERVSGLTEFLFKQEI